MVVTSENVLVLRKYKAKYLGVKCYMVSVIYFQMVRGKKVCVCVWRERERIKQMCVCVCREREMIEQNVSNW